MIGTVANFRVQKDYPTLLAACRLLAERGVAFRLVAVGQGPLEARDRPAPGRRSDCASTWCSPGSDRMPSPSWRPATSSCWRRRGRGFPSPRWKPPRSGLPIVATAVGGVAEQFGPADAVLVPPQDPAALAAALEAVLLDPCRRSRAVRQRPAPRRPRFDVRRVADTLTARYERLAGGPASPPRAPVVPPRRGDTWDVRPATDDDREQILSLLGVSLGWTDEPR